MGVLEGMCPMGLKLQETTMLKVLNKVSNYILKQHKENSIRSPPILQASLHYSTTTLLLPIKPYINILVLYSNCIPWWKSPPIDERRENISQRKIVQRPQILINVFKPFHTLPTHCNIHFIPSISRIVLHFVQINLEPNNFKFYWSSVVCITELYYFPYSPDYLL